VGIGGPGAGPWLLLGAGLTGYAGFAAYQLRRDEPLLQLRLFAQREFAMGTLVAFVYGIGLFGSTYLLPVFMQMALGYSPSRAGFALLPPGLVLAATILVGGRLADRLPASRASPPARRSSTR
jgi:MFS transporter, DHA2 family, multidrug resistance protein